MRDLQALNPELKASIHLNCYEVNVDNARKREPLRQEHGLDKLGPEWRSDCFCQDFVVSPN